MHARATPAPLDFYFALHLHQPVGNFGEVFEQHVREVYRPLLDALAARPAWPVVAHLSGPLLDWCVAQPAQSPAGAFLDTLGRLAADGRLELLLAGYYEPILATLPRADRLEQVAWLADALRQRFGVAGPGLWLTERVWEPDLARDLADAGVRYALVDDRPFLAAGHEAHTLGAVFRTEHDGRLLDLLPIDERLRYLVPFRPVPEIVSSLRERQAAGERLAVFADDAEKFGGWPGTREWVFGSGWLHAFLDAMLALQDEGVVRLVRGEQVLAEAPRGGLAYLPTGSYREMEEWSLPAEAAARLGSLRDDVRATYGDERVDGADTAFLRGSHWKHFLVKYPEANRLHKHTLAVSTLCRAAGNPSDARRAIGMAQSNDPLWHGVFGGLYLPWLRESNWHHCARAEAVLRRGQPLTVERLDLDADGQEELWVHGAHVSLVLAPHRGFGVDTWLLLDRAENAADVLTRRIEHYHALAVAAHFAQGALVAAAAASEEDEATSRDTSHEGAPSIHDLEHAHTLESLPPADLDVRTLVQVRVIDRHVTEEQYAAAEYVPVRSWARCAFDVRMASRSADALVLAGEGDGLAIRLTVHDTGALVYEVDWSRTTLPAGARVAVECSLGARTAVSASCDAATDCWRYDVVSRAKSERGLETTVQGRAVVFVLAATALGARVQLTPSETPPSV
jgi:hypothetical protein